MMSYLIDSSLQYETGCKKVSSASRFVFPMVGMALEMLYFPFLPIAVITSVGDYQMVDEVNAHSLAGFVYDVGYAVVASTRSRVV